MADVAEEESDLSGILPDSEAALGHVCKKCRVEFLTQNRLGSYQSAGVIVDGRRDALALAKKIVMEIVVASDSEFCNSNQNPRVLQELFIEDKVRKSLVCQRGWASRPAYDQTLGCNAASLFESEIFAFMKIGFDDKTKKMSSPAMCEKVLAKYPTRLDILADHLITRVIRAALCRLKSGAEVGAVAPLLGGRHSVVFATLSIVLSEHNFKVRPSDRWDLLLSAIGTAGRQVLGLVLLRLGRHETKTVAVDQRRPGGVEYCTESALQ